MDSVPGTAKAMGWLEATEALIAWLRSLDPAFFFLLILPLVVAVIVLCSDSLRAGRRDERGS